MKKQVLLTGFEDVGLNANLALKLPAFLNLIKQVSTTFPERSTFFEKELGINGVEVRALVSYLRRSGHLITSTSKGYAYTTNPDDEELVKTVKHLSERLASLQSLVDAINVGITTARNSC